MLAAVDLFTEQGYDNTTVAQIVERAGVARSTFFRYFPDKRDVLAAGQETLSRLFAEGIADAPAGAAALDLVAAGLDNAASAMGPLNRELGPRLKAAIAASEELQARDAAKSAGLAAAISEALVLRGIDLATARVAAQLGVLAFGLGFTEWSASDSDEATPTRAIRDALAQVRGALASLA